MHTRKHIEPETVFDDPAFRLQVIRHVHHPTTSVQHTHDFHELVLILSGRGRHAVGPEQYELEAGDVFVILGDRSHGYPEAHELGLVNILYDPALLGIPVLDLGTLPGFHALFTVEPRIRGLGRFRNRLRLDAEQLAHTTALVARIEEELAEGRRGYAFESVAVLMQLIVFLSRCYSHFEKEPHRPVSQVSEVLGYMERHYAEALRISDLTRVAHMSQTSLMRTFRQVMGRSPIDHLLRLRVSKAKSLLRRSGLSVTEIAMQVGFNDSNYFARQFRRMTDMSPRDYRMTVRRRDGAKRGTESK